MRDSKCTERRATAVPTDEQSRVLRNIKASCNALGVECLPMEYIAQESVTDLRLCVATHSRSATRSGGPTWSISQPSNAEACRWWTANLTWRAKNRQWN